MGWEERRGQAIIDELFRFSRSALAASTVSLCWSEPDRGGRAPEIVGMERGFLNDYFQNGMEFDPFIGLQNQKDGYTNLSHLMVSCEMDKRMEQYLSFISRYNFNDETNFFLEFEGERIAILTIFSKIKLGIDRNLLSGLHGLMSSLAVSHPVPQRRRRHRICRELYNLTSREIEVSELVGEGASNQDIGLQLGISLATVKTHISRILDKMAVGSRSALAATANHF